MSSALYVRHVNTAQILRTELSLEQPSSADAKKYIAFVAKDNISGNDYRVDVNFDTLKISLLYRIRGSSNYQTLKTFS